MEEGGQERSSFRSEPNAPPSDAVWIRAPKVFASCPTTRAWALPPSPINGPVLLHGTSSPQRAGHAVQQPAARTCSSLGSPPLPSHIWSGSLPGHRAQCSSSSVCTEPNDEVVSSPGESGIHVALTLAISSALGSTFPSFSQFPPFRTLHGPASCCLQSQLCCRTS